MVQEKGKKQFQDEFKKYKTLKDDNNTINKSKIVPIIGVENIDSEQLQRKKD